jgi:hypothetical protein
MLPGCIEVAAPLCDQYLFIASSGESPGANAPDSASRSSKVVVPGVCSFSKHHVSATTSFRTKLTNARR